MVDDSLLLQAVIADNCAEDYRMLSGRLNFEEVAFAMRPNHDLFLNITKRMTKYGRDGDLNKWRTIEKWTCDGPPQTAAKPQVIDVEKMKGLFTCLYAAAGVALLESFIGWSLRKWRKDSKVSAVENEFSGGAVNQISSKKLDHGKTANGK